MGDLLKRILTPVLLLAAVAGASAQEEVRVPAPAEVLGFAPGEDSKLADWKTHLAWFRALAEASPSVEIETIGKTTLGREMVLVKISSPDNLARQARIREEAAVLADPRRITPGQAETLARDARIVVFVSCGIHSDEVAASLTSIRLAHRLATAQDERTREILANVVVLLVPSMNPDGLDLVADWYAQSLGKPWEGERMPWLYHYYAGHDNNRDWYMLNLAETRHVTRLLYREWFPRIVVDVHQMGGRGARFFVPPYTEPLNPNLDPLLVTETNFVGTKMAMDLSAAGLPGVVQGVVFDDYWNGGVRNVPARHNMIGILTEAAGARLASPVFLEARDLRGQGPGLPNHEARGNFPDPWPGGWWRIGDAIRYQEEAVLSVLGLAARHRPTFLLTGHRLAARAIADGGRLPPHAFVLPPDPEDPPRARRLLAALAATGVEIHRARDAFVADEVAYPAGSHVVLMNQPYRAHAKDLLEVQRYPAPGATGGESPRPYDVAGWTLPLAMGVRCREVRHAFEADLVLVDPSEPAAVELPEAPAGGGWILPCRVNSSFLVANRMIAAGLEVGRVLASPGGDLAWIRPGDFLVALTDARAGGAMREALEGAGFAPRALATREGLVVEWTAGVRLGVYQPWTASIDEGWTRFVLDQFRFRYRTVHDARILAGDLARDFDCLIVPSIPAAEILEGRSPHEVPPRYAGGLGRRGLAELVRFVEEGGRVILLDEACGLVLDRMAGQVADATSTTPTSTKPVPGSKDAKQFACPGSLLAVRVRTDTALTYGSGPEAAIYVSGGPAFALGEPTAATSALDYPDRDILLSGWIEGEDVLAAKSALVEFPEGKGRWILFGFRPQHRGQTHGTYRYLFNAIYRVSK